MRQFNVQFIKKENKIILFIRFRNIYYIKIALLLLSPCKEKNYVFFVNINFNTTKKTLLAEKYFLTNSVFYFIILFLLLVFLHIHFQVVPRKVRRFV